MRSRLFVYLFIAIFLACTGKPNYVLSDRKMENVLFDLYIAEAEIIENSRIFSNDSTKKQDLLQSVFKKHKISQAQLDTSLVWYNANLKRYLKINTQVSERYGSRIDQLQAEIDRIRRAEERAKGNKLRFEDLKLQNFLIHPLDFKQMDVSALLLDTTSQDAAYRYERFCFYEEEIPQDTVMTCCYERYCFYEEE